MRPFRSPHAMPWQRVALFTGLALVMGIGLAGSAFAADRLVLRNLTVISDKTVTSFDVDGIKLDDGRLITWDELERGTVAPAKQAEFNALLQSLGEPLYRIRQRMRVGDYAGLIDPAEAVAPRLLGRASRSGYLAAQALMWGRMAVGRREEAVEPYFYCLDYLKKLKGPVDAMPGDRRLRFDPASGFCAELPPVWFDGEAAKKVLPNVRTALRGVGGTSQPPESGYIYFATLSLAAGDDEGAARVLAAVQATRPTTREWLAVIAAEREVRKKQLGAGVAHLITQMPTLSAEVRPAAHYWLAQAKLQSASAAEKRDGILQLLSVPASHGANQPELAAACLALAMEALGAAGDARSAIALRKELLEHYGQTIYAARVKSKSETGTRSKTTTEKGAP